MDIGDKMALRVSVFCALYFDSSGSNCDAFGYKPCPDDDYVLLLDNFSHLNGVAFYACGKLDGHIDGFLQILVTMYQ